MCLVTCPFCMGSHLAFHKVAYKLTLSQSQILASSKLKAFADEYFKFNENNVNLHILLFPVYSKDLYDRKVKARASLGKD